MGMAELFEACGAWVYFIVLIAAVTLVLVAVQFVKRSPKLSPVLWGCFASMICAGLAGTSVGLLQMGVALDKAAPEAAVQALGMGIGIASGTTIFSTVFGFFLAILVGIANSRAVAK